MSHGSVVADLVISRAKGPAAEWFRQQLTRVQVGLDTPRFFGAFAGVGRRLGTEPVQLSPPERVALGTLTPLPEGWALDELGRAALLLMACARVSASADFELVEEAFKKGDAREQQAVLKTLCWLPSPERFSALAVDACRTNTQPVFEAIACDNPYPRVTFSVLQFNQMVLKALFIGSPVEQIEGLPERANSELGRMVADYVAERVAAGRDVSDDTQTVVRLCAEEGSCR